MLAMCAIIFVLIVLGFIYRKQCFMKLVNLGIPGPPPNILFGNMLEIISKSPLSCHSEWLSKYGDIVGYYYGTQPFVLIADVNLLKKIQVSEFHSFINRPRIAHGSDNHSDSNRRIEGFSQQLVTLRDQKWKEVRSVITPSFTPSKLKLMFPLMNGAIDSLLQNIHQTSGNSFDICPLFQRLTLDVIGRTAFGIQTDVQTNPSDPFLQAAGVLSFDIRDPYIMLAVSFRCLERLWGKLNRLRLLFRKRATNQSSNPLQFIIKSVKEVICARRADPQVASRDLMQLMLESEVDSSDADSYDQLTSTDVERPTNTSVSSFNVRRMTDADVLDNSVLFFLAGYETTSTALAFITHFLVHYPDVQIKVRQEIMQHMQKGELDYSSISKLQYLDQVIHEALRLYPPVYLFVSRECKEDMDFGSFLLSKGTAVQVPTYFIHRDPRHWGSDAHLFKPERFTSEDKSQLYFQAFGAGPRNCVGARFALLEIKLTLVAILSRYQLLKTLATEQEELELTISIALIKPKNGIRLRAVPLENATEE